MVSLKSPVTLGCWHEDNVAAVEDGAIPEQADTHEYCMLNSRGVGKVYSIRHEGWSLW